LPQLSHAFTHFKLHIQPQQLTVLSNNSQVNEAGYLWLNIDDAIGAAIPTPVRKILQTLQLNLASTHPSD
jgi:A/G-specific adenine glycosylase